jgi:hypothetical protein
MGLIYPLIYIKDLGGNSTKIKSAKELFKKYDNKEYIRRSGFVYSHK